MNNIDLKLNFRAVVYGGYLVTIFLIIGYGAYLKINSEDIEGHSNYLSGNNIDIMLKFESNKVDFKNTELDIEKILSKLEEKVPSIAPSNPTGRNNPFTP